MNIEIKYLSIFVICLQIIYQAHNVYGRDPSYNILLLSPIGSESHRNVFKPIVKLLAQKGHKVTMLTNLPDAVDLTNENITQLWNGIEANKNNPNLFSLRNQGVTERLKSFVPMILDMLKTTYANVNIQKMYSIRNQFDLIILDEACSEIYYPFVYNKPFVFISTTGINYMSSAGIGNMLSPAYFAGFFEEYERPYSFRNRLINLYYYILRIIIWKHIIILPTIENEILKMFPDLPPLLELERNVSLIMMNGHPVLEYAMPLLPSQIYIGGLHCRPGQQLPEEIQSWLDEATDGVIYFSLGSIATGSSITPKYRDIIVEVFGKLKQKILWKYEEPIPLLPPNVLLKNWTNQQDILAHPNVRLFMTHGGMLSVTEGVYHGTPMLLVPIYGDQPRNAKRVAAMGLGIMIKWDDLSHQLLESTIKELIINKKYSTSISLASGYLRDQPEPPAEKAVWWLEYVIRHKGAAPLRSPAADLPWWQLLMLDAVILFLIIGVVLCYGCRRITRRQIKPIKKTIKKKIN